MNTKDHTLSVLKNPLAIAMWDFSWIERRWPGAGYEDWDRALDELVERGYDALRIDAYPHFFACDPEVTRRLVPCWNQHDWGSPVPIDVCVAPALLEFLAKCRKRSVQVGLSSWFREDTQDVRRQLCTPDALADSWLAVLDAIKAAGLLDSVLYVDLCNEWPMQLWAPFFNLEKTETFGSENSLRWMCSAIEKLRERHPRIAYTFSHIGQTAAAPNSLGFLDFLEPHLWMAQAGGGEFYKRIGYQYPRFDPSGYEQLAQFAEPLYRSAPEHWHRLLSGHIETTLMEARSHGLPLVTTECWAIVDYKDGPHLDWGWVKECCAEGVRLASASGAWAAIATSNFCGPQFHGMWRDIPWHREMTDLIRCGSLPSTHAGTRPTGGALQIEKSHPQ